MKLKLFFLTLISFIMLSAQSAPSYYSGIDFTKTGNDLKNQLAELITDTHTTQITYSELKTLLQTSDADPDVSGNILLIYGSTTSGDHQRSVSATSTGWNREHVYAQSLGTPELGESGPGSDGHHLRPADTELNSSRGNLLFADGSGTTAAKSNGGWFPGDEWKGDVARILMYMYVRYGTQCLPTNIALGTSTYSSDFSDLLIKWNIEDPVSSFEEQRNDIVAGTQGNRNPFIDNPYLATVIWGGPDAENKWPDTFDVNNSDTEAPSAPTNLSVTGTTSSTASLSWTASTDNVAVSGYEIYVDGVLKTIVTTTTATVTGLSASTTYSFYVIAKDNAGNKSSASNTAEGTTTEASNEETCGTEDFSNIPESESSYSDRTWTNNGITWTATTSRTDQTLDGRAICMKNGTLTSSSISGGVGSLTITTYLPFSDSDGTLTLKVNGVEKGTIPYSKTETITTINNINVSGNAVIVITGSGSSSYRVTLDNLSWTCYNEELAVDDINAAKNNFQVYPNPIRNGELYIKGIDNGENISVYNTSGQLVQTLKNVNNGEKVSIKKLPKGIYLLRTKSNTSKVIIE